MKISVLLLCAFFANLLFLGGCVTETRVIKSEVVSPGATIARPEPVPTTAKPPATKKKR